MSRHKILLQRKILLQSFDSWEPGR